MTAFHENFASGIPGIPRDAVGMGLRIPHYDYIFSHHPPVDYFEIISENFMDPAALPQHNLSRVLQRYPIVMHGVGLNLLGQDELDDEYLGRLAKLAARVNPTFISDHLCWTKSGNLFHHDLLPVPFREDLVDMAVRRIKTVQNLLNRPFALENLSSYVTFSTSTMTEWDFYTTIVRESDCWYMLDINNIYVSSQNAGFDPCDYLDAIDFSRVAQVHLAGHERQPNQLIIDTHNQPVSQAVWELYQYAWKKGGPFPTMIEWDDNIPPFPEVLNEIENARKFRA